MLMPYSLESNLNQNSKRTTKGHGKVQFYTCNSLAKKEAISGIILGEEL